jgi:hypothetical protein
VGPERKIEQYLADLCKARDWLCWKMKSLSFAGFPDRMVVTMTGRIYFVEVKAAGGRVSPLQRIAMERLTSHNAKCYVAIGRDGVDGFIQYAESEELAR